ncbi:hypothetical protein SAMN04488568_12330 [Maricaulis salignorans]|uniref:Cache domain-containing protein n=1 Tax=Maricaulis salignorans TaxID=144026 RepID=A0A1G9WAG6_9PROT|nr:hypothetical protein SAMN04488568_12330 [Maricaulis salignorans]
MASRKLAILIGQICVSILLAGLTGLAGCRILDQRLEAAQAEHLNAYIRVRAGREQQMFEDARRLNRAAEETFRRRLAVLQDVPVDAEFDRLFPVMPDGTRRSAPGLYDGTTLSTGDYVFGIGAFLADGAMMTDTEKRRYLAGFHTVRAVGEAYLGRFSNLYYFTPDRRMVMFAPEREDRLVFYRSEAPADFDLRGDEDAALFDLRSNPNSEMRCTALSRFVYADGGDRAASACRQPVRDGDELLGAFGSSISMTETLATALEMPPSHGVNMLFDHAGNIISRGPPPAARAGREQARAVLAPEDIMTMLRLDPRPFGVFVVPDGGWMIAFSRIEGPSWYFVSVVDLAPIRQTSRSWAQILALLVLAAMLGALATGAILGREKVKPVA